MDKYGRITVKELAEILIDETRNGNGDKLVWCNPVYLTKKMYNDGECICFTEINIQDILDDEDVESTPEQEAESHKHVEDYWREHPEEKAKIEAMNISPVPHGSSTIKSALDQLKLPESEVGQLKIYVEYLAENINNSINYSEYLGQKLDRIIQLLIKRNVIYDDDIKF